MLIRVNGKNVWQHQTEKRNLLRSPWNHVKRVTPSWHAHVLPAGVNLSRICPELRKHEIIQKLLMARFPPICANYLYSQWNHTEFMNRFWHKPFADWIERNDRIVSFVGLIWMFSTNAYQASLVWREWSVLELLMKNVLFEYLRKFLPRIGPPPHIWTWDWNTSKHPSYTFERIGENFDFWFEHLTQHTRNLRYLVSIAGEVQVRSSGIPQEVQVRRVPIIIRSCRSWMHDW